MGLNSGFKGLKMKLPVQEYRVSFPEVKMKLPVQEYRVSFPEVKMKLPAQEYRVSFPEGKMKLPVQEYWVSFLEVKRPGRIFDHPLPSRAEVEETVELYLCFTFGNSCLVLG